MSEFSQFSQQRAFHCPSCNGRIVIPSNLPATTGPCPHCQATITSPEPVVHASNPEAAPKPQPSQQPQPIAASTPLETTDSPAESSPVDPVKSKPDKSKNHASPLLLTFIAMMVLIILCGGAYFYLDSVKRNSDGADSTLNRANQPKNLTFLPVLEKYLAAASLEEKLPFVYNAEQLRPKMEAFYREGIINEADTPANSFKLIPLPEKDSKKGYVLLACNLPAPAALNQLVQQENDDKTKVPATGDDRIKILAFLKETDQGMKLDWEVFTQTKYRTLRQFIQTPKFGSSQAFRLIVTNVPPTPDAEPDAPVRFRFFDPVHISDVVEIAPDPTLQAGQALTRLTMESAKLTTPAQRTATVELIWAGHQSDPKILIKRFICWEFLGLGGKEIAEIHPPN
jgi:hypothetical protein